MLLVIIAISLSMDAFSLSLAYGTLGLDNKSILKLSLVVGVFHFLMPILGMCLGYKVLHILPFKTSLIVSLILFAIGINMCWESFKSTSQKELGTFISFLSFGLAVSLDSFSIGIGIREINDNACLCAFTFFLTSFLFTYLGLILGKKFNHLLGRISILVGGIALMGVAIFYFFG